MLDLEASNLYIDESIGELVDKKGWVKMFKRLSKFFGMRRQQQYELPEREPYQPPRSQKSKERRELVFSGDFYVLDPPLYSNVGLRAAADLNGATAALFSGSSSAEGGGSSSSSSSSSSSMSASSSDLASTRCCSEELVVTPKLLRGRDLWTDDPRTCRHGMSSAGVGSHHQHQQGALGVQRQKGTNMKASTFGKYQISPRSFLLDLERSRLADAGSFSCFDGSSPCSPQHLHGHDPPAGAQCQTGNGMNKVQHQMMSLEYLKRPDGKLDTERFAELLAVSFPELSNLRQDVRSQTGNFHAPDYDSVASTGGNSTNANGATSPRSVCIAPPPGLEGAKYVGGSSPTTSPWLTSAAAGEYNAEFRTASEQSESKECAILNTPNGLPRARSPAGLVGAPPGLEAPACPPPSPAMNTNDGIGFGARHMHFYATGKGGNKMPVSPRTFVPASDAVGGKGPGTTSANTRPAQQAPSTRKEHLAWLREMREQGQDGRGGIGKNGAKPVTVVEQKIKKVDNVYNAFNSPPAEQLSSGAVTQPDCGEFKPASRGRLHTTGAVYWNGGAAQTHVAGWAGGAAATWCGGGTPADTAAAAATPGQDWSWGPGAAAAIAAAAGAAHPHWQMANNPHVTPDPYLQYYWQRQAQQAARAQAAQQLIRQQHAAAAAAAYWEHHAPAGPAGTTPGVRCRQAQLTGSYGTAAAGMDMAAAAPAAAVQRVAPAPRGGEHDKLKLKSATPAANSNAGAGRWIVDTAIVVGGTAANDYEEAYARLQQELSATTEDSDNKLRSPYELVSHEQNISSGDSNSGRGANCG